MMQFKVTGMTCDHCVRAVQTAVHGVAPDARVAVDLAAGMVTVDGKADPAAVRAAITQEGYEVAA